MTMAFCRRFELLGGCHLLYLHHDVAKALNGLLCQVVGFCLWILLTPSVDPTNNLQFTCSKSTLYNYASY